MNSAAAFLEVAPTVGSGCIITDVRMPGLSGIDLLRRLADMQIRLPVIVITGHGDVPLAVEAMKSGAVDFLEKPFDDEVLLASVRSALDRSEASAALSDRARRAARPDRRPDAARAGRPRRAGRRPSQQDHRIRSRDQPANGRDLSRKRHDENEGGEPVGTGADGPDRRGDEFGARQLTCATSRSPIRIESLGPN